MKHALITGASKGIGLATAKILHAADYAVTGIARDFSSTEFTPLQKLEIDLANLDALPQRLRQADMTKDYSTLVLCAGVGLFGGLEQFSHQQIRHLIDVNLVSNLFLIKHFLPKFKAVGGKDIVIVGSESGTSGAKQGSVYCASKFALRGLAQSLRADTADADIRVMLVNPGPVQTGFFDDLYFSPRDGEQYSISAETVATTILGALELPRNSVQEEINVQPIKRAFDKKRPSKK
jgi:short-subunit dehydrogenase